MSDAQRDERGIIENWWNCMFDQPTVIITKRPQPERRGREVYDTELIPAKGGRCILLDSTEVDKGEEHWVLRDAWFTFQLRGEGFALNVYETQEGDVHGDVYPVNAKGETQEDDRLPVVVECWLQPGNGKPMPLPISAGEKTLGQAFAEADVGTEKVAEERATAQEERQAALAAKMRRNETALAAMLDELKRHGHCAAKVYFLDADCGETPFQIGFQALEGGSYRYIKLDNAPHKRGTCDEFTVTSPLSFSEVTKLLHSFTHDVILTSEPRLVVPTDYAQFAEDFDTVSRRVENRARMLFELGKDGHCAAHSRDTTTQTTCYNSIEDCGDGTYNLLYCAATPGYDIPSISKIGEAHDVMNLIDKWFYDFKFDVTPITQEKFKEEWLANTTPEQRAEAVAGSFLPLLKDQIAALDGFNDAAFRLGDHYALVMARGDLPRIIIADAGFRPVEDFKTLTSDPERTIRAAARAAIEAEAQGDYFDEKLSAMARELPLRDFSPKDIRSGFRAAGLPWLADANAESQNADIRAAQEAAADLDNVVLDEAIGAAEKKPQGKAPEEPGQAQAQWQGMGR